MNGKEAQKKIISDKENTMIKVEIEINGRKVKIQADNAQDIADAVKVLTEVGPSVIPTYPLYPHPRPLQPYYPSVPWPNHSPTTPWAPIITCSVKASEMEIN